MHPSPTRKELGSYYTPPDVVRTLVSWATSGSADDSVLGPLCGDGRFLVGLTDAVGVEIDPQAVADATKRTDARIVNSDFFAWASSTGRRFSATVGNPPFIRYQRFSGRERQRALEYCAEHGVRLSGLCSSWAPFVVAASRLLKSGGRLAFVVPAEIGHAVYARDVIRYLLRSFERVEVIAVRDKLFPDLSEDCWLLRASGFGGNSRAIHSGRRPRLVGNSAGATCTNSVHAVHFTSKEDAKRYVSPWRNELTTLSCELEGHSLGGGLLKIEPAEARRVLLSPELDLSEEQKALFRSGTQELRKWRHHHAA